MQFPQTGNLLLTSFQCRLQLTDEQKKYATQAFVSLDNKRTGSIPKTHETILDAVRLSGLNPTETEIQKLMRGPCSDYGDKLSKEEFLSIMTQVEWKPTDEVRNTLREDLKLFVENRPVIREDELLYVLTREGREKLANNEAEKIVARFGKDQEGNINIEELIDKLLAITPS